MRLLHPYAAARTYASQAAPTWAALRRLGPHWQGQILHVACGEDTAYEEAVRAAWGQDDLLIVEHDVEPVGGILEELRRCPHPLCAAAYPILWTDQAAWGAVWAAWQQAARPDHPLVAAWTRRLAEAAALGARPGRGAPRGTTWAHRVVADPADPMGSQRWVDAGEGWADLAALGCTRIRRGVQAAVPAAWAPGPWWDLDSRLAWWLYHAGAGPWHLHWPALPHHHGCACHPVAS